MALGGTLASTALTVKLQAFRDACPHVQLRLRTALSAEVSGLVRRGDATLGLRYGTDEQGELVSATLHEEPRRSAWWRRALGWLCCPSRVWARSCARARYAGSTYPRCGLPFPWF